MRRQSAASLLIRIDSRAGDALQRQIYDGVRAAILRGVVGPGTRVPSSRALAEDLGVSRTTSLLALEQLLAEGYLTARRGSGTFVSRDLPDDVLHDPPTATVAISSHPPLSRRGAALAAIPPVAARVAGPPRAFRIGAPAVDLFPIRLWWRLVNRRLRSVTLSQLDYGPAAGLPELREAIAAHVSSSRGARCSAEEVVVVAGSKPGLDLVARLLLDPGDVAWMEDPGFPGARSALLAAGACVMPVPVDAEGLDVETGARLAGRARVAFVTPSHQYPLGVPMSLARRQALLKWARAAGAWLVEDDYDSEFRYGARPVPCLQGLDPDGRVIYVGSFSKTLFPALRLGFLLVPPDLQPELLKARRALDHHPPALDQAVLADFLAEGHFERHLRRMRTVYRERLEALAAAALRHCRGALRLRPLRTGLHAVADLDGADAERVFREAAARGVEVMPVSAYASGRAAVANALVLGFAAVRPEALDAGMERLAAAIEAARRT